MIKKKWGKGKTKQRSNQFFSTPSKSKKKPFNALYIQDQFVYEKDEKKDFQTLLSRFAYSKDMTFKVKKEAETLFENAKNDLIKNNFTHRKDFTKDFVITIDGEDAKDFDDAVFIKKTKHGFDLHVHISDVSFYVKQESLIDKEAKKRATSVYLITQVLPMLPFILSNHLCSLVEGEKRLAFSCLMKIDWKGKIKHYEFVSSVIENKRRCTYQEVDQVLKKKLNLGESLNKQIHLMQELQDILTQKRMEEGSVFFQTKEMGFLMQQEKIKSIFLKQALSSERMIEEFMLLANQCAANFIEKNKEGLYRVHEEPDQEKIAAFKNLVLLKKYSFPKKGVLNPLIKKGKNKYQMFLESVQNDFHKNLFSYLLLTSMKQARYETKNKGHYGLGFKAYCHFTSPIRRYPDLVVHRLIKASLNQKKKPYSSLELEKIARFSSFQERKAEQAEREYKKLKVLRYLENCEERTIFKCVVVRIFEQGLIVEDLQTGIQGMISHSFFNREIFFDPSLLVLKNRKGKIIFEIGNEVKVILKSLNFKRMFVDFKFFDDLD